MVNTSHSVAKILQNPVLNTPGNELMKTTCTCEVTGGGIAMPSWCSYQNKYEYNCQRSKFPVVWTCTLMGMHLYTASNEH